MGGCAHCLMIGSWVGVFSGLVGVAVGFELELVDRGGGLRTLSPKGGVKGLVVQPAPERTPLSWSW